VPPRRRTEPWQAHAHWRTPPNARETNSSGMVSFFSIALAESLLHMLRIQFAIHLHKSIEGKLEILTFTSALHLHLYLYAAAVELSPGTAAPVHGRKRCSSHGAAELNRCSQQPGRASFSTRTTIFSMRPHGIHIHRRVEKTTPTTLLHSAIGPRSTGPRRRLARRRGDRLQAN
jgi:hypothetical protein